MGYLWRPPNDSIWGCPCGLRDKYTVVRSHRKGWKNRPGCSKGGMFPISEDAFPPKGTPLGEIANLPGETPPDPQVPDFDADRDPGGPGSGAVAPELAAAEATGPGVEPIPDPIIGPDGEVQNAEEIAASLNRRADPLDGLDLEQYLAGEPEVSDLQVRPGEFEVQPAPPGAPVTEARETVLLPVVVRLMHDWARSHGWFEGDGSLSAFIWSCTRYVWSEVLGLEFVVVKREEVEGDGEAEHRRAEAANSR